MRNSSFRFVIGVTAALSLFVSTLSINVADAQGKKKPAAKAGAVDKAAIAAGVKLYGNNGCAACHAIGDKGGKAGPDLSHIGKTMKADKLTAIIRDPKKALNTDKMPGYNAEKISDKEMKSLVAYLVSLK